MTIILTTTGISLYLNTARNVQPSPTDEQMRKYLREQPERASAEVKSLLYMAHPSDTLVFLYTDTSEADRCITILCDYFVTERGFKATEVRARKLRFRDSEESIEAYGLRDLVHVLIEEIGEAQRNEQDVVINATPGFKVESAYATMVGMLHQVPVKYVHEKFNRVVTLNPFPVKLDTGPCLTYQSFFQWIAREVSVSEAEIEQRLKSFGDDSSILRTFLTDADKEGNVSLSAMGMLLWDTFVRDTIGQIEPPPEVTIKNPKEKIANSLLKHGHDFPKWTEKVCLKIARIPYVQSILSQHFSNVTYPSIKLYESGTIIVLWTENGKAARLKITTTAEDIKQTYFVADKILQAVPELRRS
jgi:putative CRISPR-associated protein (TIGR02619 family)